MPCLVRLEILLTRKGLPLTETRPMSYNVQVEAMVANSMPGPNRSSVCPFRARSSESVVERWGGASRPRSAPGRVGAPGAANRLHANTPGPLGEVGPPLERTGAWQSPCGKGPPAGPLPSGRHEGPQAPRPPLGSDRSRGVSGGRGVWGVKKRGTHNTFSADTCAHIYIHRQRCTHR